MNEINRISNINNVNNPNIASNQSNHLSANSDLQVRDLYSNSVDQSELQSNFVKPQKSDLWKYLLAGGLGLFTGLALGSMIPFNYYCYYPLYYSYYYSPCWYNFGWYYW